jgi:hypothetical protein
MEIKIYGLVDPIDNKIRYVGKTRNTLSYRLEQHYRGSQENKTPKMKWINNLKEENLKPLIIELEKCDENNWIERERYWINKLNDLTNSTAGGGADVFFNNDVLLKLSEASKKKWKELEYREKVSDALKKKWKDPEYIKLISNIRTEYWSNPENRKNHSDKMNSPENIKNMSEMLKKKWNDAEFRKKQIEYRKLWNNPEYREKQSLVLRKASTNIKPIIVEGITYKSIADAVIKMPIKRTMLIGRLKSKYFPEYSYIISEEICMMD